MKIKRKSSFDKKTFGKRLKELRRAANLTQEELGEKIGRTKQAIGVYENGKIDPSASFLVDAVNFFQKNNIPTSLDFITGLSDKPQDGRADLKPKYDQLLKDFESLTEKYQLQKELLRLKGK